MLHRCCAILLLAATGFACAADLPSYPFVHVEAVGSTMAPPDIGQIDFEITVVHADPAEAVKVLEERAAQIRAIVEQAGLTLDDVAVRDIRTQQIKGDALTYDMRANVKIVVRDLSKWKAVVAPLLPLPNLDGFMTSFDSTSRAQIEAELMADAIRQARKKGDAMAAGFGRKVAGLGGVSSGAIRNLSRAMGLAASDYQSEPKADNAGTRGDLIAVTVLRFAQPVDVIFRLK